MTDLRIEHHTSTLVVRPLTEAGTHWLAVTAKRSPQYFSRALVVEPRFIDDVFAAAQEAGLEVA